MNLTLKTKKDICVPSCMLFQRVWWQNVVILHHPRHTPGVSHLNTYLRQNTVMDKEEKTVEIHMNEVCVKILYIYNIILILCNRVRAKRISAFQWHVTDDTVKNISLITLWQSIHAQFSKYVNVKIAGVCVLTLLASGRKLTKLAMDATAPITTPMTSKDISEISTHSRRSAREFDSGTPWRATKSCFLRETSPQNYFSISTSCL